MTTAIDLFAGGGGSTQGAQDAGVRVLWAGNHNRTAVDTHAANHPDVQHACQDLHVVDWRTVPACDLVLASPECKGHTPARGKERAHHDSSRGTAWAVVDCLEALEPELAVVENVAGFGRWRLFGAWSQALRDLGYQLESRVLDAADFGVPQHRERLYIVASRDGASRLPTGTHEHVPVSAALDFEEGRWTPVRTPRRATKTVDRWRAGRARFGERFVMPYYSRGSGLTGRSIDRPLGVVTCWDRWAVVRGDEMRMLTVPEYARVMGFPRRYVWPHNKAKAVQLLGNANPPPVCRAIVEACA